MRREARGNEMFDLPADAVVAEYAYDALGRRVEFKNYFDGSGIYCAPPPCIATVTTRYVYDGENVLAEYNAATTPVRQRYFVHGTSYIDERAVVRDETKTPSVDYYYLLKDLYTVAGLANKQGHEVERYTYDAYGALTITALRTGDVDFNGQVNATDRSIIVGAWTGGGSPCQFGPYKDINGDGAINATDRSVVVGQWTGGSSFNVELSASALGNPNGFTGRTTDLYLDAFGMGTGRKQVLNYRARDYDVEHGRFLQRDPAEYQAGANLYEFVRSRSTSFVDPTGECPNVFPNEIRWGRVVLGVSSNYFNRSGAELSVQIVVNGRVPPRVLKDPCCPAIGIVQIVRENYDQSGFNANWEVDKHGTQGAKLAPWYAFSDPNPPEGKKDFSFNDVPGYDPPGNYSDNQFEQQFETCVVCTRKNSQGKYGIGCVLSCFTWSHNWTLNGAPPPAHVVDLLIGSGPPLKGGIPTQNPLGPIHTAVPNGQPPSPEFNIAVATYRLTQ